MPRYKILPTDQWTPSIEVVGPDANSALHLINGLRIGEADVLVEGVYAFSARHGENGLWTIFQRAQDVGADTIPLLG